MSRSPVPPPLGGARSTGVCQWMVLRSWAAGWKSPVCWKLPPKVGTAEVGTVRSSRGSTRGMKRFRYRGERVRFDFMGQDSGEKRDWARASIRDGSTTAEAGALGADEGGQ